MGCALRASGRSFDVDEFLRRTSFRDYHVYRKGELRFESNPKSKKNTRSGINIVISHGSFDNLNRQIKSVITFLEKNKAEIGRLVRFEGLDGAPVLDFGINKRDYPGQCDRFSAELISFAGKLGLAIELTQYDFRNMSDETSR
jgi:hypothetical protein